MREASSAAYLARTPVGHLPRFLPECATDDILLEASRRAHFAAAISA